MDPNECTRNISNWSPKALAPYYGRQVAWSLDGKQILADGASYDELFENIDRLGLKEYIIGFVPDPNVSYF